MKLTGAKLALVLAPHTDDGELGCGATMAKLAEEGTRLIYVAFSAAEESVPKHLPSDILRTEVKAATQILGVKDEDCLTLRFRVRRFPESRQDILEEMVALNRTYQPDLVLLPSPDDQHQDHATIATEGFRAFKRSTLLAYEVPWNNIAFPTTSCHVVEERHVRAKARAIAQYVSQAHRSYASEEYVMSQARFRGVQFGVAFAEAFDVRRVRFE